MADRAYCVYITANERRTVLYTGVTSALKQRVWQHREKTTGGFTSRNNAARLVHYETCLDPSVRSRVKSRSKQAPAGRKSR